jgi:hypothetical protein
MCRIARLGLQDIGAGKSKQLTMWIDQQRRAVLRLAVLGRLGAAVGSVNHQRLPDARTSDFASDRDRILEPDRRDLFARFVDNLYTMVEHEVTFGLDRFRREVARLVLAALARGIPVGQFDAFLVDCVSIVVNVKEVARHKSAMRSA